MLNATDVDAVQTEINLQICGGCKFAKEPEGFSKLPGLADTSRYLFLSNLLAQMAYKRVGLDIIPPSLTGNFQISIQYRCHTCIIARTKPTLTVHMLR